MITKNIFGIIWAMFIGVTIHVALSAVILQNNDSITEQCKRLSNELDENSIVRAQFGCKSRKINDYFKDRERLLNYEQNVSYGADVKLNDNEWLANKIIMEAKEMEYNIENPSTYYPSRHIFEVFDEIKQSKLFQIIQKMPKGGILHAHDLAICSTDYVVSLTYWPNLWQRTTNISNGIMEFVFSRQQPNNSFSNDIDSQWRLVKNVRDEMGALKYDQEMRKLFSLVDKTVDPRIQFKDINVVWKQFLDIFIRLRPIVTYAPVWKAFYKHALKEMQQDGVQYLELRGFLPKLYDLDGKDYVEEDSLTLVIDALNEFKSENPSFIGGKYIYAPIKVGTKETIATYFEVMCRLYKKFPNFLAGFDLVGQEDLSPPLTTFAEQILQLPDDIKFFFHAGETNWYGSIDENLIDAVLLGARRIGHGYALAKHPKLIDLVKSNDIAVEVNPVSNQVLKLVTDYRNHPASIFLAQNIPIVISSDDPSFWEATPLSHDFYMAFLGIASRHSDLRTLKKFAMNSIQYSSLNETEKIDAFSKWEIKWDKFIDDLVQSHSKNRSTDSN